LLNENAKINPLKYYHFREANVDNLYPLLNINDDALEATYSFLNDRSSFPRAWISFFIKLTRWVLKPTISCSMLIRTSHSEVHVISVDSGLVQLSMPH